MEIYSAEKLKTVKLHGRVSSGRVEGGTWAVGRSSGQAVKDIFWGENRGREREKAESRRDFFWGVPGLLEGGFQVGLRDILERKESEGKEGSIVWSRDL